MEITTKYPIINNVNDLLYFVNIASDFIMLSNGSIQIIEGIIQNRINYKNLSENIERMSKEEILNIISTVRNFLSALDYEPAALYNTIEISFAANMLPFNVDFIYMFFDGPYEKDERSLFFMDLGKYSKKENISSDSLIQLYEKEKHIWELYDSKHYLFLKGHRKDEVIKSIVLAFIYLYLTTAGIYNIEEKFSEFILFINGGI